MDLTFDFMCQLEQYETSNLRMNTRKHVLLVKGSTSTRTSNLPYTCLSEIWLLYLFPSTFSLCSECTAFSTASVALSANSLSSNTVPHS